MSMGGGVMRAAAFSGLRGFAADYYAVSSAARMATSARTTASTAEEVRLASNSNLGASVRRPYLEMDDWIFADGEEDMIVNAAEPIPRVVFGGVPTLQEAKEATSELTVALEKAYLSSPSSEGSIVGDFDRTWSLPHKQVVETKACVSSSETAIATQVPTSAITAFRFLHESSAAKNVVASIACDPNVWNVVLQNKELQEFLQSQGACSACSDKKLDTELVADSDLFDQLSAKSFDASSVNGEPEPVNGFMDILQRIKSSVVDMMSRLSDYFQNFFGGNGGSRVSVNSDGSARLNDDTIMEASFVGLAVMAILIILLKRY